MKKVILSLFDKTENWSRPYIDAGYPTILWDIIKNDIAIMFDDIKVGGILASTPCTDFSGSGARWWKEKDKPGSSSCTCCETTTEHSVLLVLQVLRLVEIYKPLFWVIENPIGRIEKLIPKLRPYRKFSFNPCDFGDPYTKKTILWGEFNIPRTGQISMPLLNAYIRNIPGGFNQANIRSVTPKGFAKAFFESNRY